MDGVHGVQVAYRVHDTWDWAYKKGMAGWRRQRALVLFCFGSSYTSQVDVRSDNAQSLVGNVCENAML